MQSSALKPGLAGALLMMVAACSDSSGSTRSEPRYVAAASGRIDSHAEARFLVAERDAIITEALVRPGDRVAAGQALVRLSCADTLAATGAADAQTLAASAEADLVEEGARAEDVRAAEARTAEAHAREQDAADMLARAEGLVDHGFVPARRLQELRSDVAAKRGGHDAARAQLDALRNGARPPERLVARARYMAAEAQSAASRAQLAKCTLRSPIAGTVLRLLKRPGEFSGASAGAPLVVVADLSRLIVRAEILDRSLADTGLGDQVEIWMDGRAERWRGRIIEMSGLMGRTTARSLDPAERFDQDVREVVIGLHGPAPPAVVGLRVNVGVLR